MDLLHSLLDVVHHRLSWISTDYGIPWKRYLIAFLWGNILFETYLWLRQYPNYSKSEPPPALADHFTQDVFAKSQVYGRDKAKFSLFKSIYSQLLEIATIYFGGYAWAWDIAGRVLGNFGYGPEYQIPQSIVFSAILYLMSTLPSLPFNVYGTFVLEEKHGFNKSTPMLFVTDLVKGWLVTLVMGVPFLSAFLFIVRWAGDRFVPWLMGFLVIFQLLMVVGFIHIFLYPTFIQPLFNKLSPLPSGDLRTRIEGLATGLKFPLKHIYEIDGSRRSSHSNAYFFGLPWSKHIVVFDTLIKQSTPEEVETVLAHELGHWYYLHPTKLLLLFQIQMCSTLVVFPPFLHSPPLLQSFDFPTSVAAQPPILVSFLLSQIIMAPVETLVGIGMNAISRKFEWEADAFACELQEKLPDKASVADMGERLGRALITLHVKNLSTVWVDWLYSAVHNSHPTLTERLKALDEFKSKNGPMRAKKEL